MAQFFQRLDDALHRLAVRALGAVDGEVGLGVDRFELRQKVYEDFAWIAVFQ
jgi:hypothetical protein